MCFRKIFLILNLDIKNELYFNPAQRCPQKCISTTMNNYTFTYADACRNITTQWRRATQFFRKNIPLTLLKGLCVRGSWRLNKDSNILTPTLMAITAFLFRSPGLLNWGPGGPASLGHASHSSIFSPTATAQSGAWGPPLLDAGSLYRILSPTYLNFLSPGLYNNLTPTILPASITISHSIQPLDSQGHILIFLDWMHLLFTQVHFLFFWQLGRVGSQYTASKNTVYRVFKIIWYHLRCSGCFRKIYIIS